MTANAKNFGAPRLPYGFTYIGTRSGINLHRSLQCRKEKGKKKERKKEKKRSVTTPRS